MILAQSENYIISNEFEIAYLINRKSNKVISSVAEMYGDPIDACISKDEKLCVIIGCGAVIYLIEQPFLNYALNCYSKQWIDIADIWFDVIVGMTEQKITLHSENNCYYEIDLKSGKILSVKNSI